MTTFIAEVQAGRRALDQIDDWVERWHAGEIGGSLRESLGLTPEQYADWLREPASLAAKLEHAKSPRERYADPDDPLNGPTYHSGQPCLTRGCQNPAGTHWSPHWCQPCNAVRLQRIGAAMTAVELGALVKDIRPAGGVTYPLPTQE